MIQALKGIWALISGSKLMWNLIRHHVVLTDAFKAIEGVLVQMRQNEISLPNHEQTQILLFAVSNILKTGVIDIPGVDEYEIAIGIDQINSNMMLSIQDSKSGSYHQIPILKKEK